VLANDAAYAALLGQEFSMVTPENSMKWQPLEPQPGQLDFRAADALVAFAQAHDQRIRGHTLVWHNQLPPWLVPTSATLDDAALAALLQQHIAAEVGHFRGAVYAWDVVNEPFNDDGSWRPSLWYTRLGRDYVAQALSWAHAADPDAKLYINDYNIEALGPKSDALYALVAELQARGVPLDGVGVQAHLASQYPFPATLEANLQRFADLGLDVAITEADVRLPLPADAAALAQQAAYFGRLGRACASQPRCVSFSVWGFTDAHSWVPGTFAGQGAATPFDASLQPKPAYAALQAAFAAGAPVQTP